MTARIEVGDWLNNHWEETYEGYVCPTCQNDGLHPTGLTMTRPADNNAGHTPEVHVGVRCEYGHERTLILYNHKGTFRIKVVA